MLKVTDIFKFSNIFYEFKEKTNKKKDYIQYISALLYLKYYKMQPNRDFIKLCAEKNSYFIKEITDDLIRKMRENIGDKDLFSNIKFSDIVFYRELGEKNILSKIIEKLEQIDKDYYCKFEMSMVYDKILKDAILKGDIIKERGEFYTPIEITEMMTSLIIDKKNADIYDPVCGSGNFLISAAEILDANIFGEEKNLEYYNICKTKMLLKEIDSKNILYKKDKHIEEESVKRKYDYIVSNPPFSEKNWKEDIGNKQLFIKYGLKESAVGDYAYVLKMLETLKEDGTMAVILPHGVLFRENEKNVRKSLIEKNYIKAIIGLPENLFFNTRMSVVILILSKKQDEDTVLFIDASDEYINSKKSNVLLEENQKNIFNVVRNYEEIKGFSHIATKKEIRDKDYNLTIKKYIIKKTVKKQLDKQKILKKLQNLSNEQDILEANIKDVLNALDVTNINLIKNEMSEDKNIVKRKELYKIDYKQIGKNIREARHAKNYTQEVLAEKLEISVKYISRIESGMSGVKLQTMAEICNILGITMDALLKNNEK